MLFKVIRPFFFMVMRIFSWCVFLLTLISAYGGKVNPFLVTLPALLCLALPYLAILTILLTVFWIFNRKIILSALGVGTIILCLAPISVAFPLSGSKSPKPDQETFKIISWNVLHTNDIREPDYKGNRAVEFMINSGADIIALTELLDFNPYELSNLTVEDRNKLFGTYPYREGLNTTDIKLLSKYPVVRLDVELPDYPKKGGYDFFEISFPENKKLVVGMVHLYSYGLSKEERKVVTEINSVESAKSSMKEFKGSIRSKLSNAFRQRAEMAEKLRSIIDDISPDIPLIVCGDFNDVPTSWTYNIVRSDDMRDAYVETNFGPAITYNLNAFYFHIDQMLYRGPLEALSLKVDKINTSDHYPLVGEFAFLN